MGTPVVHCLKVACRMPLNYVLKWTPFHIDALGIVTLIGAEQVNSMVGRLVASRYTEYLPLLGAYVIASNSFTDAYSGFAIFNIPAGIMTTDIAGWFSRWCLAQHFSRGCSSVTWTVEQQWDPARKEKRRRQSIIDTILALAIGILLNGFLLVFTILQGDWWGLANAISMVISIIVRWYVVKKNRDGIDNAVSKHYDHTKPVAKCFVTFNDGKQINVFAPSSLVKFLFSDKPVVKEDEARGTNGQTAATQGQPPGNPAQPPVNTNQPIVNKEYFSWYFVSRVAGWIAFAAHVVTIGQSGLATQIVTVFIIVISTVLTVFKVGCDDSFVGSKLHADITRPKVGESERRRDAFIALELTEREEKLMRHWSQMPLNHSTQENLDWWEGYRASKDVYLQQHPNATNHPTQLAPPPPPSPPQQHGLPTNNNTIPMVNVNHLKPPTVTAASISSASGSSTGP